MMTPAEIRDIRFRLKMSQQEFADKLGVAKNTVWRWEQVGEHHSPPNDMHEYGLKLLEKQNV